METAFEVLAGLYVEADEAQAKAIIARLGELFAGRLGNAHTEPFPKYAGWLTIWFGVAAAHESPNAQLIEVAETLAEGWEYSLGIDDEDFSATALWKPGPEHSCLIPEARFAALRIFCPETPAA